MDPDSVLTEAAKAAEAIDAATRQRDECVRSARRLGVSTRRIAAFARMSHTQVRRICA